MSGLGSKDRKKAGGDNGPGWILTYGDMVTLLLAFFVMLFAVSSVEAEKFDAFVSGLGMFGNTAASGNLARPVTGPIISGSPPVSPVAPGPTGEGGTGTDANSTEEQKAFDDLRARVDKAVEEAGLTEIVSVRDDPRGVAIVISTDDVLFATGSADVTPDGEAIIAVIAPILRDFPNQIQVEGHADNKPLNRNGYTNWNLSTDRSVAVVEELAGVFDIAAERLTASGFGQYRPVDPRDTPEARARNRRVEIVVMRPFGSIAGTTDPDAEDLTAPINKGEPDIGKDSAALPTFPDLPLAGS